MTNRGCWDLGTRSSCRARSEGLGRKRGNCCRRYNNERCRPPILRRVSNLRLSPVHKTGASWADDFRGSSSPQGTEVPLSLNILQETAPAVQACLPVCVRAWWGPVSVFQQKEHTPGFAHEQTLAQKVKYEEVGRGPIVVSVRARLHDEKQSKAMKRSSDRFTNERTCVRLCAVVSVPVLFPTTTCAERETLCDGLQSKYMKGVEEPHFSVA